MKYISLTVKEIISERSDFKTIVFEEGHGMAYKAGQYLTFVHHTGFEEIRRSYSILSSPFLYEPLMIGVKRIANGIFSRYLHDKLRPGDLLETTGAGGFFLLPDNPAAYQQLFFLAAGSGITPILSLIKTALHQHAHLQVALLYSTHTFSGILYQQQLEELKQTFAQRFLVHYFVSQSPALATARLNRVLLIDFVTKLMKQKEKTLFYICGPEAYMRMCTYALREMQVSYENIRKENFAIDKKIPPPLLPPDKATHRVKLTLNDSSYEFEVAYPDTILKAARRQGIDLPYSCDTGRCGSCVAVCTKGQVWLSYNEVLTEKELSKGLTLTCVGHPVFGDVELRIGRTDDR